MTLNNIAKKRISIFKNVKNFTKNNNNIKSALEYPCTWFLNSGYYKLRSYYNPKRLNLFSEYLRELFLISTISNYDFYQTKNIKLEKKKD